MILAVSLLLAGFTSFYLKQAIDVERELRAQMADLSLATTADANATSGIVSLGEASLTHELVEVRGVAHHDEVYLALEGCGILAGLILLRRPAARDSVRL